MRNVKYLLSFVGTVMAGFTALTRIRQAHQDGDRLELFDAALHVVVVITGTVIVVRRLRLENAEDE